MPLLQCRALAIVQVGGRGRIAVSLAYLAIEWHAYRPRHASLLIALQMFLDVINAGGSLVLFNYE